jgi:endogenous inhibitor of DNA gyrase (YacG/DUF329 family)
MRHRNTCRVTCAHCGTDFESYSWAARKYCSHACYILARFGQSGTEEVLR